MSEKIDAITAPKDETPAVDKLDEGKSQEQESEEDIIETVDKDEDGDEDFQNDSDDDSDDDDAFEYDEEGNIIIPDDDEEDGTDEKAASEDQDEDEGEKKPEKETSTPPKKPDPSEDNNKAPEKSLEERYNDLKRRYGDLERQAKEALKKMDISEEDVLEGLVQMNAESEGVTKEEYKKRITAAEEVRAADLKAIQDVFPHAASYKSIYDLPNVKRFAELRIQGATPIEAYRATHADVISAKSVTKTNRGKEHLTSTPKAKTGINTIKISSADMSWMRSEYPGKTDKELIQLYRKSMR